MNNYRLLGLSLVTVMVFLSILTFRTGIHDEDLSLILTFETGAKFSLTQLRIFIVCYFFTLSAIAFWRSWTIRLPDRFFWLNLLLLITPLTIFTIFTVLPEWTTFPLFSREGIPRSYYADINNYGRFNIGLIILNAIGLFIFGFQIVKELKRTW